MEQNEQKTSETTEMTSRKDAVVEKVTGIGGKVKAGIKNNWKKVLALGIAGAVGFIGKGILDAIHDKREEYDEDDEDDEDEDEEDDE